MSGRKVSNYQLQREREERLRLARSIASLREEIGSLKKRVEADLAGASAGLRASFPAEVARAEKWVKEMNLPGQSPATATGFAELEKIAAEGRSAQQALTLALTRKADEAGKRLSQRLAKAQGLYLGQQELLRVWFPEQTAAWERALGEAQRLLAREQYPKVQEALETVEREVTSRAAVAAQLEEKHQKRLYLVESLRKLCSEMGFKEVSAPRAEKEGERGSAILFKVDTVNQGIISFTITLEGITSDAEVSEHHCLDEFGALSKYLEEEFGIETEFRVVGGEPRPALKHAEAKSLPKSTGREREAG